MAQRGDNKAMSLSTPNVAEDTRRKWPCPHPFCFEFIFGHRRDLQEHVQDVHKCGRCNHGKHHKCKKDICPCGCRWGDPDNTTINTTIVSQLMEMMGKRPKIDGDKINHEVYHRSVVVKTCVFCQRRT